MHARIDQLLSLRDGEPVDATVERHLAECHPCSVELTRLREIQQRLQQLDSFAPPPRVLPSSQNVGDTPSVNSVGVRRTGWAIAAGCVLAVVIGLGVRDHSPPQQRDTTRDVPAGANLRVAAGPVAQSAGRPVAQSAERPIEQSAGKLQPEPDAAPLERLVARSQHLDELLLALPARPSIERVAQAATIDTLEHRIQWLDEQLFYAPEQGLNDSQAYRLWRERVDLMDSLVKVRYAEGQHLNF